MSKFEEDYGPVIDDINFNRTLLSRTPSQTKEFIKNLDSLKRPKTEVYADIERQITSLKQKKFIQPIVERRTRKQERINRSEQARTMKVGGIKRKRKNLKRRKTRKNKRKFSRYNKR